MAEPGKSPETWRVVQTLLGPSQCLGATVLAMESPLTACFQSVGPGRSSGRGSFSLSDVYFSILLPSVSNGSPLNIPSAFHKHLFLLLIANAYRMCPACQALGQGECAVCKHMPCGPAQEARSREQEPLGGALRCGAGCWDGKCDSRVGRGQGQ